MSTLHFIFDGDNPNARFVEVETPDGRSVSVGEWRKREDGYNELVIPASATSSAASAGHRDIAKSFGHYDENCIPSLKVLAEDAERLVLLVGTTSLQISAHAARIAKLEAALELAAARLDHASFVCSNMDDADLFQEARDKARAALTPKAGEGA